MALGAKVSSIEAIRAFKAALQEFAEDAALAVSEADSDVQRTIWWVTHDQFSNWTRELKKRNEKLAQAKADLVRAQIAKQDTQASAVVERKAVARAEARVAEAEEKLRRIKKWTLLLEREQMLFKAACQQINGAVQGDIPNATARLGRMIENLEQYVRLQAPQTDTTVRATAADTSAPFKAEEKTTDEHG